MNQQKARVSPDYLQHGIIYQMFLRSCTPQGTLAAAQKLIPHIASLGATIIYLCPVAEADDDMDPRYWSERQKAAGTNNPKNPYRWKDYYHVDPEYGTDDDLRAFVQEAHRNGLRVWLDVVYFHCGPKALHIQDHPDWVKRDENEGFDPGHFGWAFPMHDFDHPEVREFLWDNMVYWVKEFDADGYRCDVASEIPIEFWLEGRRRMEKIKPDVTLLCEGDRPVDQLEAFDLNYGFPWYYYTQPKVMRGELPASAMKDAWEKLHEELPQGARIMRICDTHGLADTTSKTIGRNEKTWTSQGMDAALCLNYWIDGVPLLYNGMEVCDDHGHDVWADRFHAKNAVVDWSYGMTKTGRARLALLKKLAKMRKEHPALLKGETKWVEAGESLLVFERECQEEKLLCAVNLGRKPVPFKAPETGEKIFARMGKDALPAFGVALYRIPKS